MSLNGLDAPQVLQVYNASLNEAGGWLLLKYISRDEVELLDHGKGGVTEARASIALYPEPSPLYGLIMYRRKKVLIKYVPEGTSRLLQARTSVHLQDVLEKYSPYDAMVEVTSAEALSDTTLAAAFPLHTSAPAIRQNKLDEISEDAEEPTPPNTVAESKPAPAPAPTPASAPAPTPAPTPASAPAPAPSTTASRKPSTERWPSRRSQAIVPQANADMTKSPTLSQKSSVSRFLVREESGHQSVIQLDTPATSDYAPSESDVPDTASVMSGRSERELSRTKSPITPSDSDQFDFDKYYAELYKPKVRLGPRPVVISDKSRRTASIPSRPISTLPASMQAKSNSPDLAQMNFPDPPSGNPPSTSLPTLPPPPPIPDNSLYPPRPNSRGSTRSLPLSTISAKTSKSTMTPEKMRLMKAMELRKKQMRKSTPTEAVVMPSVPENASPVPPTNEQPHSVDEGPDPTNQKADSGIQIEYGGSPIDAAKTDAQKPDNLGSEAYATKEEQAEDTPRAQTSSIFGGATAITELQIPKVPNPVFSDSPTMGRAPDSRGGGLPRSPALSSLVPSGSDGSPVSFPTASPTPQAEETKTEDTTESHDQQVNDKESQSVVPDTAEIKRAASKKRRGLVEPLTINVDVVPTSEHEHNYLSDEDFLEELQSATFQEAKPISLQRSPASPFFPPRRPSGRSIMSAMSGVSLASILNGHSKNSTPPDMEISPSTTAAAAAAAELLVPETHNDTQGRSQSVSSAVTVDSEQSDSLAGPRNRQVSSGISKRIQALAEKSAKEGSPSPSSSASPSLSEKSSYVNLRKGSLQNSTIPQNPIRKPTGKLSVWPAPSNTYMTQSDVTVNHSLNHNSVSVKARIVRQPGSRTGSTSSSTDHHTRPGPSHEFPPMAPMLETSNLTPPEPQDESQSPTFSHSSVDSAANNRKSFDRKSYTGRYRSGYETPTSTMNKSSYTASIMSDDSERSSRTSRFFKRISHIGGNKRKSVSQTPRAHVPEPAIQVSGPSPEKRAAGRRDSIPDIPPAIIIGDLNVQFPDTYLWKRKWVEIDHEGNLIFTASRPVSSVTAGRNARGFVTKFNLTELHGPYIPDVDRQEMPHSVLLDLADGATLSCASEDSMAQRQLLSLLRTYHQAWTAEA